MVRETYTVTIERSRDGRIDETKQYIKDALGSWGGGSDPESPFFEGVKVLEIRKVREYA